MKCIDHGVAASRDFQNSNILVNDRRHPRRNPARICGEREPTFRFVKAIVAGREKKEGSWALFQKEERRTEKYGLTNSSNDFYEEHRPTGFARDASRKSVLKDTPSTRKESSCLTKKRDGVCDQSNGYVAITASTFAGEIFSFAGGILFSNVASWL